MALVVASCKSCGAAAYAGNLTHLAEAGWRNPVICKGILDCWYCPACVEAQEEGGEEADEEEEEQERARAEAYDLETCARFEDLVRQLFINRRIAYPILQQGATAAAFAERALLYPDLINYGALLGTLQDEPCNYEAL